MQVNRVNHSQSEQDFTVTLPEARVQLNLLQIHMSQFIPGVRRWARVDLEPVCTRNLLHFIRCESSKYKSRWIRCPGARWAHSYASYGIMQPGTISSVLVCTIQTILPNMSCFQIWVTTAGTGP